MKEYIVKELFTLTKHGTVVILKPLTNNVELPVRIGDHFISSNGELYRVKGFELRANVDLAILLDSFTVHVGDLLAYKAS